MAAAWWDLLRGAGYWSDPEEGYWSATAGLDSPCWHLDIRVWRKTIPRKGRYDPLPMLGTALTMAGDDEEALKDLEAMVQVGCSFHQQEGATAVEAEEG